MRKEAELMDLRTDLALEQHEINGKNEPDGTEKTETTHGNARITQIKITNENGEKALKRKRGTYITVELPGFGNNADTFGECMQAVATELK